MTTCMSSTINNKMTNKTYHTVAIFLISHRKVVEEAKSSLTPSHFNKVHEPSHESEQSFICMS
jgi:hypothetical protein